MSIKKIIVLFFLILSVHFNIAQAQESSGNESYIGIVNLEKVYSIHPLMLGYDKNVNRFIKPIKTNLLDDFTMEMNKRIAKAQNELKALNNKIKPLEKEIADLKTEIASLENKKSQELTAINEKAKIEIANTKNEKESVKKLNELNNVLVENTSKYQKQIEPLNKKLNELNKNHKKEYLELLDNYYCTTSETQDILKQINNDIREALDNAAKKENVKIIMNINRVGLKSTENSSTLSSDSNENEIYLTQFSTAADPAPSYKRLICYNNLMQNKNFENSIKEFSTENDKAKKNVILQTKLINASALTGGKDLTQLTILLIFVKYNIDKELAQSLCDLFDNEKISKE